MVILCAGLFCSLLSVWVKAVPLNIIFWALSYGLMIWAICRTLSRTHRLYIVTNAVASVQRSRLHRSAVAPYITDAFISEEAGASKPSRAYFDYVFARIPGITRENCLLIGDSPSSDIRGANNADIPCCWYDPHGTALPEDLRIDYRITDLRQLYDIV